MAQGVIGDWLTVTEAARQLGKHPESVRRLVRAKVFTRGRFTEAKKQPPIYISAAELAAYQRGGIPAVRKVRQRLLKQSALPGHDHELGEPVG